MIAVCCSSEKFARSQTFIDYVDRLCRHVLEQAPRTVEELAAQDWSYEGGTVAEAQRRFALETGESVRVQNLAHFAQGTGHVWAWTHPDSRRGVILSVATEAELAELRDVAFQLAGQILVERAGELVMGDLGLEEFFDPETLLQEPWARKPERCVGEVLQDLLGLGTRLEGYARFDVS